MTRIYEPRGPRARLGQPQSGSGFSPVTAVDTSRQTLAAGQRIVEDYARARRIEEESELDARRLTETQTLDARRLAETQQLDARQLSERIALDNRRFQLEESARVGRQMLENASNNLSALSQFSDTLNKFLFETGKQENERLMKLGIADIMNGEAGFSQQALENFQVAKDRLAEAATSEASISDVIAEVVSPLVSENHRATSPSMRGWRAYGQSKAMVQKAASMFQPVMEEFMQSDRPIVPVPNEDGTTRLIAPSQARPGPETIAAFAVGQQLFINSAGLANVNPVLISEHLSPTAMGVRAAIMSNRASEFRAEAQREAITRSSENIASVLSTIDPTDTVAFQDFWQSSTTDLNINGRLRDRGKANRIVVEQALAHAEAMADADPIRSRQILQTLANTPLIADQPNGVTVGEMFRPEFQATSDKIDTRERVGQELAQKAEDDFLDNVLASHNFVLATPGVTSDQIRESFDSTIQELRAIGSPRALNELIKLEQRGGNYNPLMASRLAQEIASGIPHTAAGIDQLWREGVISSSERSNLIKTLPSSAADAAIAELVPEIKKASIQRVRRHMTEKAIPTSDRGGVEDILGNQMAEEVTANLKNFTIANPGITDAEKRQFIIKEIESFGQQERFQPLFDPKTGQLTVRNLEPESRVLSFKNPTTDQINRDLSGADPAVLQSVRASTTRDLLLTPQELAQNAKAFIEGGQPTPRARSAMIVTGSDWETLLRDQHTTRGLPFTEMSQSQAAQAAQQRRALAPADAAMLTNPNATPQQRINAWNNIEAARLRQERRQQASNVSTGGAQGTDGLLSLIRSAEGGWTSVNRGRAGDTPGGMPNLTSMSIGQIESMQSSNQLFAVGAYQFTPGVLARARQEAGLSTSDPFTPENQNRMAMALLTGTKRPRLAAFLLGQSDDIDAAHLEIAQEWAGLAGPSGRGYYDGDRAGNRASAGADQVRQMLIQARQGISGRSF